MKRDKPLKLDWIGLARERDPYPDPLRKVRGLIRPEHGLHVSR